MGLFDALLKLISPSQPSNKSSGSSTQATPSAKSRTQRIESMSLDMSSVLSDPEIKNILTNHVAQCCNEIESIPQEFRENIAKAVLDNFYGTLPDGVSLIQQMQSIYRMPKKEISLIARDQTSKLTARLNQARQQDIGVKEYIWRAVDNRCNHFERDKKKYKWSKPPAGGHPGQSYLCTCHAQAVVDVNKIARAARG